MNELLVIFIFLFIFSSYPTSSRSRPFKIMIIYRLIHEDHIGKHIFKRNFVKQGKSILFQYKIPFSLVKQLELWFLWCQMAIHIIPSACCFIFHVLWSVHRKWLKALTRMSTFHPYIDRLCKTNPYMSEKCLFHLRRSVYGNIYTVGGFPWSFDMTSRCLNWQLELLWWLPGLIGDIGKNCWLMGVIKNDKN